MVPIPTEDPTQHYELTPEDIVYIGLPFDWRTLCETYARGIFPWPHPDEESLWFSPQKRGVLHFDELHIPKKLKRLMKKEIYTFTTGKNFEAVMRACQLQPRKGQSGTWIIDEMIPAYCDLFKKGFALSVECWREKKLVGGIYGVFINNHFSAESMFGLETNVSKLCLLKLIKMLQAKGLEWMDIQMVTPLTQQFGGKYVSKQQFNRMLAKAAKKPAKLEDEFNPENWGWPQL